jgi:hypothetical protein
LSGDSQISWLFFKAQAKYPDLVHNGRASPAVAGRKNSQLAAAPEGCVENGLAASLLVNHVSI